MGRNHLFFAERLSSIRLDLCIRTLDRCSCNFEFYYKDDTVSVEDVKEAVKKELEGPGKLLG